MSTVKCLVFIVMANMVNVDILVHGGEPRFRSSFTRYGDKRLSSLQSDYVSNMTLDACSDACLSETAFQCKSFDYDNIRRSCYLYSVNLNDRDVNLIDTAGRDHYETNYLKKFTRLTKHKMPVATRQTMSTASVEECARLCLLEVQFKCRGFNFRSRTNQRKDCLLLNLVPASEGSLPAIFSNDTDFYQLESDGPMNGFINYGMGLLRPTSTNDVYGKSLHGVGVESCAQSCLDEAAFTCLSFDYIHDGDKRMCHLSRYTVANVKGLVVDSSNPQHNHYEKIERFLDYFYPTLYALIPGSNHQKLLTHITPNLCAQMCLEEEGFVCRSFDYEIYPEGTCKLHSKTARDVGGLDSLMDLHGAVHHFEMKPLLDCGGNLTDAEGDFASPNWPRNYAHHEDCTWNIAVSEHKVILLRFAHFDLQQSDNCNDANDQLLISELDLRPYCVTPNTKKITTKSSSVSVRFKTNGQGYSQGFRAFYSAEWKCDVNLNQDLGQFASPKWPNSYPSGSRCSWRVTAPDGHRIQVVIDSFSLRQNDLGHCNEVMDHVRFLDGGTISSSVIGLYCGSHRPFTIQSSGRDMFIQFNSNNDLNQRDTRQGFHGIYVFKVTNETGIDSRFIDLKGKKESWKGTDDENVAAVGASEADRFSSDDASRSSDMSSDFDRYRSTMWTVVALLLIVVLALTVSLYLVIRHYRQKLNGQEEKFVIENGSLRIEDVPMRILRPMKKQTQDVKFNNLVDLPSSSKASASSRPQGGGTEPSTSCACASDDDELEDTTLLPPLPLPQPPPRIHRPLSMYSKYPDDNLKNTNIDAKRSN